MVPYDQDADQSVENTSAILSSSKISSRTATSHKNKYYRDNLDWAAPSMLMLRLFAANSDAQIRIRAAGHENTPREILKKLATDSDNLVRLELASNKRAPHGALAKLARDHNILIRLEIARNPRTSFWTLIKLLFTKNHSVRSIIWERFLFVPMIDGDC